MIHFKDYIFQIAQSISLMNMLLMLLLSVNSCQSSQEHTIIGTPNWTKKIAQINENDSLEYGKTYLSIYSQIYSFSQNEKYNLTCMVSLRNTSDSDTIYLLKADYYNTEGLPIRTYFEKPIFLSPLETTEIIINHADISGGTGSNFIFEWKTPIGCPEPLFEGVMSSMQNAQGLSFTTQGKRIK